MMTLRATDRKMENEWQYIFTLIHLKILRDKFLRVIFYNFLISLKNINVLMAKIKIKFLLFVCYFLSHPS